MKKSKNTAEEVSKTLELLDKVQRQKAPVDLHDRIMGAISKRNKIISLKFYRNFQLAAACLTLLMLFNAWLLFQPAKEMNPTGQNADLNSFIKDYNLSASEMYYFEN
ncbi:MAG: hypothetical protein AAF990_24425 [Bacteroidota bacterium]